MTKKSYLKYFFIFVLFISLVGLILCFPLKLPSGKTCLLHEFFGEEVQRISNPLNQISDNDILMKNYLKPFAFIWWSSLAGIALSVYQLNKKHENEEKE